MNYRNILIISGVIGTGFILYKLLLGLVLPIALFVSLGYILKFLLKGSDDEKNQDFTQALKRDNESLSNENIVEIKPIKQDKSNEVEKIIEVDQPNGEAKATEVDQPADDDKINKGEKLDNLNL
tara:strand:- start:521 stop:892 length:372 start_codon:yes stop_codon:yes gene_type:complete